MDVIWHKVWFDLWQNKLRTVLAVFSIAAGVFAIGAIFGLVDQLLDGMDTAHRAVSPSHVNIFLRTAIDRETAESLRSIPGVVDVEPVNQISVRYKRPSDDEWLLGSLLMRQDFDAQKYDVLALKAGEWPEDTRIGVERLSSQFFDYQLGDDILFEMDGADRVFTINGIIRHPFVQPPPFGGEAYFFTDAQGMARFGIPEGYFRQVLVQVAPYTPDYAREVTGAISSRLAKQGVGVSFTLFQEPDVHWGRPFVEGLTLVLKVMAIISLFLSAVLVTNTLTALITQQTDQIGVIKAVGGVSQTIVQIYLAGVLVYGLLSLLTALPLGMLTAFFGTQWFLNLFNIDYDAFQWSPRALLFQLLAAVLVPLLAGLWPVLKGASITVREAIASYGIGGDFGTSRLDQAIDRVSERFLSSIFATSLGNMFRRKGRLLLTMLVLVVAGITFMVVMSLISSTNLTLDNEAARRQYDIRIGFTADQREEQVTALALALPHVTEAELWYAKGATILRGNERLQDSAGLGAQLIGIPLASEMQRPYIVNGRWLQPGDTRVIVMSMETAEDNHIAIGDTVRLDLGDLGEDEWTVIGTYRTVFNPGFLTESLYAPEPEVVAVTKQVNRGSLLHLKTDVDTLEANNAVADALKSMYERNGMGVSFTTAVKLQERQEIANQFQPVVYMLLGLAVLMASVGGIGLMGALGISVVERTREIGVMRAIGAQSHTLMALFVMEGMLQGLLSWIIAIPISFALGRPLAQALGQIMIEMELDYAFNTTAVFIWLVVILLISLLASIMPARNATRISVRESLAYA